MNRDVFISYSRKNYDAVIEIKRQIDAATGAECWIDLNGIESGSEEFTDDIINGINNCKVFLFMLSEQSQESEWALRELRLAKKKNKHVVLVNIDGVEMNDRFFFNYSGTDIVYWKEQAQRDKLIGDLCRWIGTIAKSKVSEATTQPDPKPITGPAIKPNPKPASHQPHPQLQLSLEELEERLARLDEEVGDLDRFEDDNGFLGFKNKAGKVVIPCEWEWVSFFSEGLATVKDSNNKYGFIDKTGTIVIPCEWRSAGYFSEGLAAVEDSNKKWGFIDKTGIIVIPCVWRYAGCFSEGLAAVEDSNKKWGFIDKTGIIVIPCVWDYSCFFSEGLGRVKDSNGKMGYIDKKGKLVIPCEWDNSTPFENGLAYVQRREGVFRRNRRYKIDKTGKVIS